MNAKIYFDKLPSTVTELMGLFSVYGNVVDIHIQVDRTSLEPRSYGFVTMITPEGARAAIQSISGRTFGREPLVLSEASQGERTIGSENDRTIPRRMMSHLY
jgi:RNA recognition motif-containing protein